MNPRKIFAALTLVVGSLVLVLGAGAETQTLNPVNITKFKGHQSEATIAIDPTNTQRLFMATNPDSPPQKIFALRSSDGGTHWAKAGKGVLSTCCDNVTVWDEFGNLWLANITGDLSTIVLYMSTDGGATFTIQGSLGNGEIDQPAIDEGGGTLWWTFNQDDTIKA